MAELIVYGDPTPGAGGEFERECFQALRDRLPNQYTIITNCALERGGGAFYECDAVVEGRNLCDILEIKRLGPWVEVYEDFVRAPGGFGLDSPFSLLDSKAKVLKGRRQEPPFPVSVRPTYVGRWLVVPDYTEIRIHHERYRETCPVKTLPAIIAHYKKAARDGITVKDAECRLLRDAWRTMRDRTTRSKERNDKRLGRFTIKRHLGERNGVYEYWACDEPPSAEDARLREYPFDPLWTSDALDMYLRRVSREMRALRRIRHQYVLCVTGHFRTASSWVQVSDWFDGRPLEEIWTEISELSLPERLELFRKVLEALVFCHDKGVFHRNLSAMSVIVSPDLNDVRVTAFEYAKNLASETTVGTERLRQRDQRLMTPEELISPTELVPRRTDVFQAGLLLYRILENGAWPYDNSLEYYTSGGALREMKGLEGEGGIEVTRRIVKQMIALNPENRPDPMHKVKWLVEEMIGRLGEVTTV
jgi:hypothetical protein